jgi:hypothetical protein
MAPPSDGFRLTAAQLALAREHGFASWADLGADPNIPDKHHQSTPLGWARYFDQPALVNLLEPITR